MNDTMLIFEIICSLKESILSRIFEQRTLYDLKLLFKYQYSGILHTFVPMKNAELASPLIIKIEFVPAVQRNKSSAVPTESPGIVTDEVHRLSEKFYHPVTSVNQMISALIPAPAITRQFV